MDVKSRDKK